MKTPESRSIEEEAMPKGISIAIDGPVASGKGTLAAVLADRLNGLNLNTGAMYRSIALLALEKGIQFEDEAQISSILPEASFEFNNEQVYLNGVNVTEKLKDPQVTHGSSVVAVYSAVREDLGKKQREISRKAMQDGKVVVVEGRDIGTRVLPDASIKIFLTANQETRAQRRLEQYQNKGIEVSFEKMLEDVRVRDERDMGREVNPLPRNPESLGYWVLDNSNQAEDQTIQIVLDELRSRGLLND